ncbi:MAG: hypothetical protein IJ608_05740 [Lachnospiraceae bacterium]|nr:hypothetical protein [Lachnospiraceae bacterium]
MKKLSGRMFKFNTDRILFIALLVLYSAVMLYLFINECFQTPDFTSDMPAYVNKVAGIRDEYEFPYPLLFWLAKLFSFISSPPMGLAFATMLLNTLGVIITRYYFNALSEGMFSEKYIENRLFQHTLTISVYMLFLLGNLYGPQNHTFFGFDYIYRIKGIYNPNPFWNATYLATRPFAIICFFSGAELLNRIKADKEGKAPLGIRECLIFAVSLFLTTFTKPSFTMVFVPVMGFLLLYYLIRSKGKTFKSSFIIGISMLPTALDLCYQFFGVFSGTNALGEDTGVAIGFLKMWGYYSNNIPLSIVMGMAFPIGVFFLNLIFDRANIINTPCYLLSWFVYIISMIMMMTFYEKGFRLLHANFSWGYMHGMFFVFMISIILMIKNSVDWKGSWKLIFVPAEWGVLLFHLGCGINFLIFALGGNELALFG